MGEMFEPSGPPEPLEYIIFAGLFVIFAFIAIVIFFGSWDIRYLVGGLICIVISILSFRRFRKENF